ncbi:halocyanin [Haloarcula sp. Atlit-7R]|uniref:halocyanin n=2 Tax=Haloarculaceae TaxID=1963268 RepID=UPI001F2CFCB1|nr:halocyanin [Haloarcula sp. Atlit-7R]
MDTNKMQSGTNRSIPDRNGLLGCRRVRSAILRGAASVAALGFAGTASAQEASGGAVGGGSGSGLFVTAVALGLTGLTIGAVYLLSWRDRPEQSFSPATATEDRVANQHTGQMFESNVAQHETESVAHDAFDPVGTGLLLVMYFVIISLMWLFMYFVEFLGNGPSVVG